MTASWKPICRKHPSNLMCCSMPSEPPPSASKPFRYCAVPRSKTREFNRCWTPSSGFCPALSMFRRSKAFTPKPMPSSNVRPWTKPPWQPSFSRSPCRKAASCHSSGFTAERSRPVTMCSTRSETRRKNYPGFCKCTPTSGTRSKKPVREAL